MHSACVQQQQDEEPLKRTGWEVVDDNKSRTPYIFAELLPPCDPNALPTTRSRDAGNRDVERNRSCRMHSRLQGGPTLEQRGRQSLRRNSQGCDRRLEISLRNQPAPWRRSMRWTEEHL